MGLAAARGLALALDIPVAGVSTLAALAAGAPDAVPLIDAKRHRVVPRTERRDRRACPRRRSKRRGGRAWATELCATASIWSRRAPRFRRTTSELHLPLARFHAQLAHAFGPAEHVEPVYVRAPDADRMSA